MSGGNYDDKKIMTPLVFFTPFSNEFISNFFNNGNINKDELINIYNSSKYNKDKKNLPIPLQLWNFYTLSDNDFVQLCNSMNQELEDGKYNQVGLILHAFGIKLELSKNGLIETSKEHIVNEANHYISNISFPPEQIDIGFFDYEGAYGMSYRERNTPEFIEIVQYMKLKINNQSKKYLYDTVKNCWDLLPDKPDKFLLNFSNLVRKKTPQDLVTCIPPSYIYSKVINLENKYLLEILSIFKYHLNRVKSNDEIFNWVESFCTIMTKEIKSFPNLKKYIIETQVNELKNIMESPHA